MEVVEALAPRKEVANKWICKFDPSGSYTSKSAYVLISSKLFVGPTRSEHEMQVSAGCGKAQFLPRYLFSNGKHFMVYS